jgi:phosphoglycolate phosphatase
MMLSVFSASAPCLKENRAVAILMTRTTLAFDLDGTLVDTAPDLVETLNVIFRRRGIPPVPYDRARLSIGGGAKAMISRGLAAEGQRFSAAELEILFAEFIEYYSAHIADRSRPFPGVERALEHLAANDFILSVCTNKREALSRQLLDTLGLSRHFAAICGQDTFAVQKPDPLMLTQTIAAAGGDVAAAIMIGDSSTDVSTARAAGIPIIAVDFGYTEKPIAEFGPDCVISHFDGLPAAIAPLIARG